MEQLIKTVMMAERMGTVKVSWLVVTVMMVVMMMVTVVEGQRQQQGEQLEDGGSTSGIRCPPKCLCFRTTVRCMFLGLKTIPHVPPKTTILDLRFNKIRTIQPGHFSQLKNLHTLLLNNNHITRLQNGSFTGLESLRYLYLYKNRIRVIERGVFQNLARLEQLYLHFNDLTTFEAETFSNVPTLERLFLHNNRLQRVPRGAFSSLNSLRRLRLDSNALICDCQMMWLAQMVKEKQHTTQVAATCQFPSGLQGKSLTSLTDSEFQCVGEPLIKEGPADVDVKFGRTTYFTCRVEGDPQPEVTWLHNNEVIGPNERYSILTDGTLMIEDTQHSDMGFYECLASNQQGEVKSRKAKMAPDDEHHQQDESTRQDVDNSPVDHSPVDHSPVEHSPVEHSPVLTVTAPPTAPTSTKPRFLQLPSDVSVTEGEPAQLLCRTSGIPRPDIVWSRSDEPVVEGPRIQISSLGAFSISATIRNDSGIYRCTAANHLGRISASATLRVLVPPRLTVEPNDQYAGPGTSTQFTCQADGVPQPIISWFKNGEPIVPRGGLTISLHGISLGVANVRRSDEGEYTCRAQNDAGTQEASAVLYVRDQVAPVIHKEPRDTTAIVGQDVAILECKVDGRPRPAVTWRKDGTLLQLSGRLRVDDDGSLFIYNVTEEDAGTYECNAQNLVGYTTARAIITIQETSRPRAGDEFLEESFEEAQEQVDRAVNDTISQLFQRNRGRSPAPHELLRIFRFPSSDGREIARAAEKIEQTLRIVKGHVESGMVFNLTSFSYQDLLSPEKLHLLTNLSGCLAHRRTVYCDDMCFHTRYRTIDGSCNNLRNPLWGASLTGFRRVIKPVYENGFNTPVGWSKTMRYHGFFKPSARLVSTRIMSTEEVSPDHHCSHMLMQWGQFLDHDLDHALPSVAAESFSDGVSCIRSCDYAAPCFPIEIPPDDPRIRHHRCMEFTRSSAICGSGMTSVFFDNVLPREQINQLTSFIDASQVYGSSAREMRLLRNLTINTGHLREGLTMPGGKALMPFSDGAPVDCRRDRSESAIDCFLAGDIRANEQSGLTAMHTLWFREHNRIADALNFLNPHWDGDRIFHEARKIVGAEMQHITYTHWLPHIIGQRGMEQLGPYKGYNPNLNPTISNVFATAAYRFGHSLINPILHRLNSTFQPIAEGHLPLHKAFFSPWRIVQEGGIDPLLRGLFAIPAKLKMPGQFLNTELTEKLFRAAQEVALDLAALNIQRGRDHGLPGYTDWRQACNLSVPNSFDDLADAITSQQIRDKLTQLYGHPGNVDLWVGGLLEDPVGGARVGPTFLCLLVDQFRRLRDGDRFWYESPTTFKPEQLEQLKETTLGRILCDNGDSIRDVTEDVFVLPRLQNPAFVRCQDVPIVNLRLWTECCTDCQNDGHVNSLAQSPGFRFRRQAQFSHKEDRDHARMQQHVYATTTSHHIDKPHHDTPEVSSRNYTYHHHTPTNHLTNEVLSFEDKWELYSLNASAALLLLEERERQATTATPNPSPQSETDRDWVPEEKASKEVSPPGYDTGDYEPDVSEQRIEGIEVLVEQLSKNIVELQKKVRALEHMCGGGRRRKRRRKVCVTEGGMRRQLGETWHKDPCTSCKCRAGNVRCRVITCPLVSCADPVQHPDKCCPVC